MLFPLGQAILAILLVLYAVLPKTVSMSIFPHIRPAETFTDNLARDQERPLVRKRHVLYGPDDWRLCPAAMTRVECFYEYLDLYVEIREAVTTRDSRTVRNIGKRSVRRLQGLPEGVVCPEDVPMAFCRSLWKSISQGPHRSSQKTRSTQKTRR